MILLLRRLLVLCSLLLAAFASPVSASENVTQVKAAALPPLRSNGSPATLLVLDGQPLVVQGDSAVIRSSDRASWLALNAGALGRLSIRQASGDGARAIVTSGDGRTFLVTRSDVNVGLRALAALPFGAQLSKVAIAGEEVVAISDQGGRSRLLRLSLADEAAGWRSTDAPGGRPLALVGQAGTLFLVVDRGGRQSLLSWTSTLR